MPSQLTEDDLKRIENGTTLDLIAAQEIARLLADHRAMTAQVAEWKTKEGIAIGFYKAAMDRAEKAEAQVALQQQEIAYLKSRLEPRPVFFRNQKGE